MKQAILWSVLALAACADEDADTSLYFGQVQAECTDTGAVVPRVLNLWPPNHKLHAVTLEDCLGDYAVCDPELHAEFVWASSDEPIDSIGDGHHAPDIVFDGCERVQVRSERQGPKDGRMYKLGVRLHSGGTSSEGVCTIVVDHDQRGVLGEDSGEAYRIALDGTNGTPVCNGSPTPDAGTPATPDAGSPPVIGF